MNKTWYILVCKLILFLLAISLSACNFQSSVPTSTPQEEEKQTGEPDRLGLWAQGKWKKFHGIENRSKGWKQIVQNSEFQLGETILAEDEYHTGYTQKFGTYPRIDGSYELISLSAEFARQHLGFSDEEIEKYLSFWCSTMSYGDVYANLFTEYPPYAELPEWKEIEGERVIFDPMHPVDIVLGIETPEQSDSLNKGQTFIEEPICWDAFVFITHKDNPIESLTVEQIKKIYTGEITNWKELGGQDENIIAYQRDEDTRNQIAMENLVMQGMSMINPPTVEVVEFEHLNNLVEVVAEYQNGIGSIGYIYKSHINNLYEHENIRTIKVDGIEPSDANIRNHAYPFSTNYYGVIRANDRAEVGGRFLDWVMSEEGQLCVEQAGYTPMIPNSN